MYYYKVGYDTHESTPRTVLGHEKNLTDTRFEAIVFKAIEDAIENQIRQKTYKKYSSFSTIFNDVINLLLQKGFKKLSIANRLTFDGASNLLDRTTTMYIKSQKLASYLKKRGYRV